MIAESSIPCALDYSFNDIDTRQLVTLKLTPAQATVLFLYLEGNSIKAIGEHFGKRYSWANQLKNRILCKLRGPIQRAFRWKETDSLLEKLRVNEEI